MKVLRKKRDTRVEAQPKWDRAKALRKRKKGGRPFLGKKARAA